MKKYLFIATILSLAVSACSEAIHEEEVVEPAPVEDVTESRPVVIKGETSSEIELSGDESQANTELNKFGLRLFNLVSDTKEGNFALSPISNIFALSMMANALDDDFANSVCSALGCENITTLNSLCNKLMMYLPDDSNWCKMSIANSVWHRPILSPTSDFLDRMNGKYYADVSPIDFRLPQAADTINLWVDTKTNSMIKELVTHDMICEAALVTANAFYFTGAWIHSFEPSFTKRETFHGLKDDSQTDFMHLNTELPYCKNDFGEWTYLPYGKGEYRMIVALPNKDSNINEFLQSFDTSYLYNIDGNNPPDNCSISTPCVNLSLPKFNFVTTLFCENFFNQMGVNFETNRITGLVGPNSETANFSKVIHKTFVDVDEEGTRAAGATANIIVTFGGETVERPVVDMNFNRPFVFFITNCKTGSIIIAGKISQL